MELTNMAEVTCGLCNTEMSSLGFCKTEDCPIEHLVQLSNSAKIIDLEQELYAANQRIGYLQGECAKQLEEKKKITAERDLAQEKLDAFKRGEQTVVDAFLREKAKGQMADKLYRTLQHKDADGRFIGGDAATEALEWAQDYRPLYKES